MTTQNNHFLKLVERAMQHQGRMHMRPVIEKELLHYDILFALDSAHLLDNLVFQGGTALRLCYAASRFSEDLDFAGGFDFSSEHLCSMKNCLETYLVKRYGLEISIKEPNDFSQEGTEKNIQVNKWQIRIVTHPERKDIPKQLIKIEIANIPAYSAEARQLVNNYDFLPDNYKDTIVMTESLEEIFADKIVAFIQSAYVRHRDIWDFHWLQQQGAQLNLDFVKRKLVDYQVSVEDYRQKKKARLADLENIILGGAFQEQMSRFLTMDMQDRTLEKNKFLQLLLRENKELFEKVVV